jgi:glycosyltransferase involved in cell wall biosynthesis
LKQLPVYVQWSDVVHLTAVYSFPTIPTLLACKRFDKPVVWSPRGALQRWGGTTHVWQKALWEQICWLVAPTRLVLHVTSEEEADASLRRLPGIEVVVIPNGVEIPEKISHVHGHGVLRLLYLGRLHPIKGIDNLLAACKILKDSHCAFIWRLTIAGTGDQRYTESLMARIDEWALAPQVKMIGEVVGNAKQGLFEHTDLVVVPSYTENFGMVIAEALAHGVPVIASTGTPWRWLEEKNCGLWVNNDPENLANAIKQMSLMSLREMGDKGRLFVQERFAWENIAKNMIQVYDHSINSTPSALINS